MKRDASAFDALAALDFLGDTIFRAAEELQTSEYTWRRLLLLEPKRRPKTMPLREYAANQVPTVTRTKDLGAIEEHRDALTGSPRHYTRAQWLRVSPEQVRWETPKQQKAWKLLLAVPAPITRGRIARSTLMDNSWSYRWQQFFAAAGALVKTRDDVYVWAWDLEEAR